ncbi:MAG: hypothetical protein AAGN35_13925 [Bacteroidota bacterium]
MKRLDQTVTTRMLARFTQIEIAELCRFARFVELSPPLYAAIEAFGKHKWAALSKKELFVLCHPNDQFAYSDNRLQVFLYRLREFIYEYIAVKMLRSGSMNIYHYALKYVREQGWLREERPLYRKLRNQSTKGESSLDRFIMGFTWEETMHVAALREGSLGQKDFLVRNWYCFEQLILAQALRYHCLITDLRLNQGSADAGLPLPEGYFSELMQRPEMEEDPFFRGYRAVRQMQLDPTDAEIFQENLYRLDQTLGNLEPAVREELMGLAFNQALRLWKQRSLPLHLLRDMLIRKTKQIGKVIHPRDLKNMIALLVHAGKLRQARAFLSRHHEHIAGDENGHARRYNEAVLLYYEGEFREARRRFQEVIYANDDWYLKADGRLYLWRCQIEIALAEEEYDPHFYSFEKEKTRLFFRRNGNTSGPAGFYRLYAKLLWTVYEALMRNGISRTLRLRKLRQHVEQLPAHPLRHWLSKIILLGLRLD